MNPRRIALLFIVVAALGAYLFFYEFPKAEREAQKVKLVDAAEEDITGVTLDFPDRQIVLQKDGAKWKMVKPLDFPADDAAMKSLLIALTNAEVQRTLDDVPTDLAPFGLDRPNPTVTLTTTKGAVPAIHVGNQTKIGSKTYVRRGDDPKLMLSPTNLRVPLDKQTSELREKTMLPFADATISRIEIAVPNGEPVVLTRKEEDVWSVGPGDYVADETEVRSFLSSLRATRAVDFTDDAPTDLAKYGLDAPKVRVTVTSGQGDQTASGTLSIGGELTEGQTKKLYAMRSDRPGVVTVGDYAEKTLAKNVTTFRDKTVLAFDPEKVTRIALERRVGIGANLERGADGNWSIPGRKDGQSVAISRLLDDVRDLRGADIATDQAGDLAPYGLDAPTLRVTLYEGDTKLGTVLASSHDGKFYAIREGQPTVYELRDYMYARLDKEEKNFLPGGEPEPSFAPAVVPGMPPPVPPAG